MLDMGVTAQPLACDVKLVRRKAKLHECHDAHDRPQDGFGNGLQACRVDDLTEVAQPVAEVDLLALQLREAVARGEGGWEVFEDVCQIAVSPDKALELAARGHLACAERGDRLCEKQA